MIPSYKAIYINGYKGFKTRRDQSLKIIGEGVQKNRMVKIMLPFIGPFEKEEK